MPLRVHNDFHGNALTSREVNGFALRETIHNPGVKIPKHSHERAHLAFVLRGSFEERCENRTLQCSPLTMSFLGPGTAHSDNFGNGVHCLLIEIAPNRLKALHNILQLDEPIFLAGGRSGWLGMRLYNESCRIDPASLLAVEGLILEILAEVSRKQKNDPRPRLPRWLTRAREILHAQFTENLTHEQIANMVSIHPVHLATEFRRFYGCTLGEYVRQLKVEHACREIIASSAPIVDIALSSGFSDQSHFSKVFRSLVGMTPTEFRINLRKP